MASLDNLTVTSAVDDPTTVVAVGQIDAHTSSLLDDALAALPADAALVVDLAGVTFVDSSGLRVIVRAHKRQTAGSGELVLRTPSEPVSRLLDITGLTSELTIRF
ncbi:MAG: STAS domain-containing protein [Actinomycetota bacterium]